MTNRWVEGSRPKTLPASVGPAIVGCALAFLDGHLVLYKGVLALLVALFLQIGTNFANDYSDGVRGSDKVRVGPRRLVASGVATASEVKRAAFLAFGTAAALGVVIVVTTHWWLVFFGLASILAGWFYTGGSHPYGYYGFGELFVFVFFGLVETIGSVYIQTNRITLVDVTMAAVLGLLITSILVANNLRDIPGDTESGKRTLAVRMGAKATRKLFSFLLILAIIGMLGVGLRYPTELLALLSLPLFMTCFRVAISDATGTALIPLIASTGRIVFVVSLLSSVGFVIGHFY